MVAQVVMYQNINKINSLFISVKIVELINSNINTINKI